MKLRKMYLSKWSKTDPENTHQCYENIPLSPSGYDEVFVFTEEELKIFAAHFFREMYGIEYGYTRFGVPIGSAEEWAKDPSGDFQDSWVEVMRDQEV